MDLHISLLASFIAGLITFISPCILPLIPSFLSLISGISLKEMQNSGQIKAVLLRTIIFICGFSVVFILLGMSASAIGRLFNDYKDFIRYLGAFTVIILGLHITGFFRLPFLYKQFSFFERISNPTSFIEIFIVGCAFALGWTTCAGAILSPILFIASIKGNAFLGFKLLLAYSLGLGFAFLSTAIFINYFFKVFKIISKYFRAIEIISGIVLIITGILLMTNSLIKILPFFY